MMFSFIKNWFSKERNQERPLDELKKDIQEESTLDATTLKELDPATAPAQVATQVKKVSTELSLHPIWEEMLDPEKKYTLRFLQADLPEMTDGTVGVTGFSLIPAEGGITVAMFFRNGSHYPARFTNVILSVYLDNRLFARQSFNMEQMGLIPPYTSRPWEVFFPTSSYVHDNFAFSRWKVKLHVGDVSELYKWPKELDLDEDMAARMTDRQKNKLESLLQALPPIRKNTVDITGFDIGKTQDGRLVIGLLFQNGLDDVFSPSKLDIRVSTPDGSLIASGVVTTDKIQVKPNTSRPWLMVFPADLVKDKEARLRYWVLEVKELKA